MTLVTFTVAVIGALLVLRLRPVPALLAYFAVLCWYNASQTIVVGGVHLTAARVVIPLLVLRCVLTPSIRRRFRWLLPDVLVILLLVGELVAGATTSDLYALLQNRFGAFFDAGLPYFAARLIILTKKDLLSSDGFFLLPNDIVYVEPLSNKTFRLNIPTISLLLSGVSTLILVMSFVLK